jgi:hypothetical protein
MNPRFAALAAEDAQLYTEALYVRQIFVALIVYSSPGTAVGFQ